MANVKISGLPAATSVTAGTDVAPLVSGGITTKATPQQIVNAGLLAPGAIGSGTPGTGKFTTVESTIATGTAPFTVASTTNVANLNASSLGGATFASPGAIGSGTASTGAFTTLSASSTVSGTGFSTYLLSPPAIGTTAPAAGKFTDLTSIGNTTIGDASTDTFTVYPATVSLINSTAITAASTKTLTLNGGAGSNGLMLDSSNNIGAGIAAQSGYKFYVSGATGINSSIAGGNLSYFENTSATGYGLSVSCNSSNTTYRYFEGFSTSAAAQKIAIYTDGNVRIAVGSTYGILSDQSLKTNIENATDKLNDLCSLKVRNFSTIDNPENKYIGFIAQEFEEIFPNLITKNNDVFKDGRTIKGIKESALIPILVKAIQELSAKVEILDKKLN